jgi:hypothetical protein
MEDITDTLQELNRWTLDRLFHRKFILIRYYYNVHVIRLLAVSTPMGGCMPLSHIILCRSDRYIFECFYHLPFSDVFSNAFSDTFSCPINEYLKKKLVKILIKLKIQIINVKHCYTNTYKFYKKILNY